MAEVVAELSVGAKVGPYVIEQLVGVGGTSLVYRARGTDGGDAVALKVARSTDESTTARFRREASLLARIEHPGVVALHGSGSFGGAPILATEWVEGETLARWFAQHGAVDTTTAIGWAAELAEILDHLDQLGITHRDLSMHNVILDNGRLTLIDLGLGRSSQDTTVTVDRAIAGTPRYVAPEVIRGDPVDGRADQYSLAVILHELLTGASPFPEADTAAAALYQQLDAAPEPLTEVDPTIPVQLETAVLRALATEPSTTSVAAMTAHIGDTPIIGWSMWRRGGRRSKPVGSSPGP